MQEEFGPLLETAGQEGARDSGMPMMETEPSRAGEGEPSAPIEAQETRETRPPEQIEQAEQIEQIEQTEARPMVSPEALARANELLTQARVIERLRGVDVLSLFRTDAEGRQRVLSGEWDMTDLLTAAQLPASRVPSPVRSANGAVGAVDVRGMSDAQFASLNRMLAGGQVVDVRG